MVVLVTKTVVLISEDIAMESLIGKLTMPPGQFRLFRPLSEQTIKGIMVLTFEIDSVKGNSNCCYIIRKVRNIEGSKRTSWGAS